MLNLTQITQTGPAGYSPSGVPMYNAYPWQGGDFSAVQSTVINTYSVLSIPAYWRAMNFLSMNLASFPRSVHKDGAKRAADEPAHPVERLLRRQPNSCQNATVFWRTLFFHAAHTANGYAEVVRGDRSAPAGLRNLMPEDVCPFRYEVSPADRASLRRDKKIDVSAGVQQYYLIRSQQRVLLSADVIHLQALGYDGMCGADPIYLHAETFQRAATLNRYQTKYLQKGTVIRGAVEIPEGVSEPQVAQIVDTIRKFFTGPDAERDVIVLSDGAKLKNETISPQESQLIEQGAHVTKEIAQLTGVPPQFLYEFSESKYNNSIEQMGQDIVRYTFRPWIEQAEDELTTKLLSGEEQDNGYSIRINPGALLRGSTKEQETIVGDSVKNGIRTRNEGRALLDLPPDPDPESNKLKTLGDTAPAGGGVAVSDPANRLSTWHVDAAAGVMERLVAGTVRPLVATELLVSVGIPRERAEAMVADASGDPATGRQSFASASQHEFSSTQFDLPAAVAKKVLAMAAAIPDQQLAEDGRESEPHITVKYGLHTDDADAVRAVLAGQAPVTVTLGRVSIFAATTERPSDVVKLNVAGDGLHRLNKLLAAALPHTDTHPGYQPHVTLAYVKPGVGKDYEGRADVEGTTVTFDRLTFSSKSGAKTEIVFGSKATTTDAGAYAALAPVIAAACQRVDRKTEKAFENSAAKSGQERTIWSNVFAEQQAAYVTESLTPIDEAIAHLGGSPLQVDHVAERYAAAIRKRAATGEAQTLRDLVGP